jgi:hypothetical protein
MISQNNQDAHGKKELSKSFPRTADLLRDARGLAPGVTEK